MSLLFLQQIMSKLLGFWLKLSVKHQESHPIINSGSKKNLWRNVINRKLYIKMEEKIKTLLGNNSFWAKL